MSTPGPAQRPSAPSALWRLLRGGAHIARGWRQIHFGFARLDPNQRAERVNTWAREMLRIWDIGLSVHGCPGTHGTLLMANHISWLDIVVLLACSRGHFVAKADLARWPVLGPMIAAAGTVFVERGSRRDVKRVVSEVTHALQADQVVVVFPEGTTTTGQSVLPFHANIFEAAVTSLAPVQPVSLRYRQRQGGQLTDAPAYVGDDSLLTSVWRTLRAQPFLAQVHFLPPEQSDGRSRREWAADVRARIVEDLSSSA
jgi:1-acyl-sn-glycerol-3-phosphate acyltransferase